MIAELVVELAERKIVSTAGGTNITRPLDPRMTRDCKTSPQSRSLSGSLAARDQPCAIETCIIDAGGERAQGEGQAIVDSGIGLPQSFLDLVHFGWRERMDAGSSR